MLVHFLMTQAGANATIVLPFMSKRGNKDAFQIGAMVGTLSYAIQALSWLPRGAARVCTACQYAFGIFLLHSLPSACIHSMRAMIIKQGVTVTTCVLACATVATTCALPKLV